VNLDGSLQARSAQTCRRARARPGQALRVAAKRRPVLTDPARGGCENCGRGGRMLAARVEQKNGTTWAEGEVSLADGHRSDGNESPTYDVVGQVKGNWYLCTGNDFAGAT
jgi:hypothetical protein